MCFESDETSRRNGTEALVCGDLAMDRRSAEGMHDLSTTGSKPLHCTCVPSKHPIYRCGKRVD